jgi:hypothetical protein
MGGEARRATGMMSPTARVAATQRVPGPGPSTRAAGGRVGDAPVPFLDSVSYSRTSIVNWRSTC